MNEMLETHRIGAAAQRRFVGDASHELRSPLATIISRVGSGVATRSCRRRSWRRTCGCRRRTDANSSTTC